MSLIRHPYFCNARTLRKKTGKKTALGSIFHFLLVKLNAQNPKEEIIILFLVSKH